MKGPMWGRRSCYKMDTQAKLLKDTVMIESYLSLDQENDSPLSYHQYANLDANEQDQAIVCHTLIDACNGSIAYRLVEHLGTPCSGKIVLDAGAGTGQVTRFLKGFPGLSVEACDIDPESEAFFRAHPELKDVTFINMDILADKFPKRYDAIVCRGVYHHIPKSTRPAFLKALCDHAGIVIIADEGTREYSTNEERLRNCDSWYRYVIGEAKRRGISRLAKIEATFWEHEKLNTADDGGDFKESPSHLIEDARQVGLKPASIDRVGPWEEAGGGFFTATFVLR
jgi:SAM-dependent methyltransferase